MRGALASPPFRRLLGAWTIGSLADSALYLTLGVWAKDLSGSSSAASLIFLALAAPVVLFPLIGLLADRVNRKPLLVWANLAGALVATTLLTVQTAGQLWLLYGVAFAYGTLGLVNSAAQTGLVRDMLPVRHLDTANGLLTTIDQGLRVLSPVVGSALYVAWGGSALAIGVAVCLVLTALVLLMVRVRESAPEPRRPEHTWWQETAAGLAHLRSVPLLWRMVMVSAAAFGVVGFFDSALFELVDKGLGMEAAFFGVLMGIQGAGSVLGGLTAALVLRRLGPAVMVATALALLGAAGVAMAADLAGVPLLPVAVTALFAAGVAIPWLMVAMVTTRQRLTPSRLQGRAAAAANVATTLPQMASIAAGAALVAVVDYRWLMIAAGGILIGCALTLTTSSTPASRVQRKASWKSSSGR
ncbi:MFS transporter [Nonomuraea sp. K274]|uniref:MFS transporter n=1 Tax=Nonomuraea cypriaca TaxID=1187855 RepID=A0A931EXQ9_9ACTN|nr:MFS transporter [Nonomuraea cypriaca]MBF8188014.1 MFS transporter [Nonomuraea cypriaca]